MRMCAVVRRTIHNNRLQMAFSYCLRHAFNKPFIAYNKYSRSVKCSWLFYISVFHVGHISWAAAGQPTKRNPLQRHHQQQQQQKENIREIPFAILIPFVLNFVVELAVFCISFSCWLPVWSLHLRWYVWNVCVFFGDLSHLLARTVYGPHHTIFFQIEYIDLYINWNNTWLWNQDDSYGVCVYIFRVCASFCSSDHEMNVQNANKEKKTNEKKQQLQQQQTDEKRNPKR